MNIVHTNVLFKYEVHSLFGNVYQAPMVGYADVCGQCDEGVVRERGDSGSFSFVHEKSEFHRVFLHKVWNS